MHPIPSGAVYSIAVEARSRGFALEGRKREKTEQIKTRTHAEYTDTSVDKSEIHSFHFAGFYGRADESADGGVGTTEFRRFRIHTAILSYIASAKFADRSRLVGPPCALGKRGETAAAAAAAGL